MLSSLEALWFSDFITCAVDGNYSVLVVSGTPTTEELADAWIVILSQYQSRMKSAQSEDYAALVAKIERLNTKILQVEGLLAGLAMVLDLLQELGSISFDTKNLTVSLVDLGESLKEWGYDYDFTPNTIEKDIFKVQMKLGNEKTQLAMARVAYDEKQEENTGTESTPEEKRQRYYDALTQMSLHYKTGSFFRAEAIKTSEFVFMFNQIQEYQKQLTSQENGK